MKLLILLLATLLLNGCVSTKITSFTDPSFVQKKYNSYAVVTPGLSLAYSLMIQNKICAEIKKNNIQCSTGLTVFPPTRTFSNEEKSNIIKKNKIEAYLIVHYGSSDTDTQASGNLSYGTLNVYGNSLNTYGMSSQLYSYSRTDRYSLVLIDTATLQKAWVGGANIHANGRANITDELFTTSLASEIANDLKKSGHIALNIPQTN